jgi:hypothetical protein
MIEPLDNIFEVGKSSGRRGAKRRVAVRQITVPHFKGNANLGPSMGLQLLADKA